MIRKLILAAAVCGGVAAPADALFPPLPTSQQPIPPYPMSGVEGQWFYEGNPRAACFIERLRGPGSPNLMLTNEKGERSMGEIRGSQVIAYDWGTGGGLVGDVQGNAIYWRNGTQWFR